MSLTFEITDRIDADCAARALDELRKVKALLQDARHHANLAAAECDELKALAKEVDEELGAAEHNASLNEWMAEIDQALGVFEDYGYTPPRLTTRELLGRAV